MLFPSSTTSLVLAALTLLPSTLAHFTLEYPPTRGFDEDLEVNICGGFPTPNPVRTPFSLANTSMAITSHHTLATVSVLISFAEAPTTFYQFSNGTTLPLVKDNFQIPEGPACFFVDVGEAINTQTISNGTEATFMVRFSGGDGDLYQCSDVILLTDYTAPSNSTTCASLASTRTSSSTNTSSSSAAVASSTAATSPSSGKKTVAGAAGALMMGVVGVALMI
ncbi:hypothetical protein BDY24DRAFT_414538 [Mrakia frigida]|uniref:uncharacterized protein n=1 Tax=Mrakia frigida TaxID=29902 RepID=UPI003FCC06ED